MLKALIYAYVLGGLTFIPLVVLAILFITIYTSVPVGDCDVDKKKREKLELKSIIEDAEVTETEEQTSLETNDLPRTRKGWLTMRHTFEESAGDGGYVNYVRSLLDSRSKDPKKSRPKDMWYVVLKGKVLYLYEDEDMVDCGAVVELGSHDVVVYPEGQTDGEMFAKRNAICLKPKEASTDKTLSTNLKPEQADVDSVLEGIHTQGKDRDKDNDNDNDKDKEKLIEGEKRSGAAQEKEQSAPEPWFIFARSNGEMEDWYLALIHASDNPALTPTLQPLEAIFRPTDMNYLVSTLDEQPDVIPMRWLNALLGRVFFSYYRTHTLESYIIGRLMKKLSKVKRPNFLTEVVVTEVSVGSRPPMFSKPMLKELTKEGDASLEVHVHYKGEVRITIEATAIINLGQFRSYTVKLVLAVVLKELEGNLLVKVKRPPSNRIWYAFTQNPRMVLQVEPIVSDRQIKWGMILSTIESKLREIIQESVVMPYMDDIAFFESSAYRHRGGIWSDASRSEKPRPSVPRSTPEEMLSTVSAPPILLSESSSQDTSPPAPAEQLSATPESEGEESRPASVIPVVREQDFVSKDEETFNVDRNKSEPVLLDNQRGRSPGLSPSVQSSTPTHPETNEPVGDVSDDSTPDFPSSRSRTSSIQSVKSHKSGKLVEPMVESSSSRKSPEEPRDGPSSPTPSSFLSTLKSKAGDKQALSNTARETIRKWGVNWGNLKKEFTSDENGDIASKLRSKLEGGNNKRVSYAEVRAAVEDRRERERSSGAEEEGGSSRSASPEKDKDGLDSEQQGLSQTNAPLTLQQTGKQRPVVPVPGSKKGVSSVSQVTADIDNGEDMSEDEIRHVPIQAQPQGKTMTIPGIHASHKGDVMSMGYVAPTLTSPQPDSAKTKGPAIQSVYRLWRNPALGQDSGTSSEPTAKITSSPVFEAEPSTSQLPSRLSGATPPPLPPRRISGASTRPNDRDQREILELSSEPVKPKGDETLLSDVEVAGTLSGIDGTRHSSSTSTTINTPPPLPPRRISSTA